MSLLTLPSSTTLDDLFGGGRAPAIDDGRIPTSEGLAHLGRLGVVDLGTPGDPDGALADMATLIAGVAERSLAAAFSLWAHRIVIEYLCLADRGRDLSPELTALRTGRIPGATAMAAAVSRSLGIGDLGITHRRENGGIRLDGRVPWASNLFEDGFLLVTASTAADGSQIVVAIPSDTPGIRLAPHPELLALGATASTSLALDRVVVSDRLLLTEDLDGFITAMRGPFLLLQSAFALGLTRAALRSAETALGGVNAVFSDEFDELARRFAVADADLETLCGLRGRPDRTRDVLELRLEAAVLARDAVDLEVKVRGGAGYLLDSPTARRLREATFLPIQSPTEALLRRELS